MKHKSLVGNGIGEINRAVSSLSTPITSEEVARQIRVTTDPSSRQLEKFRDLMLELHKDASGRNEETSAPVQGPSRPARERFDMVTGAPSAARSKLLHGTLNPMTRQLNQQRRPFHQEDE